MSIVILAILLAALALIGVVALVTTWRRIVRGQAQRAGYTSVGEFLRAALRSDEERRDAGDMAIKGLVLCVVGLIFPPLILLGAFPLFYGARKVAYASMGLGLVDDPLRSSCCSWHVLATHSLLGARRRQELGEVQAARCRSPRP